MGYMTNTEEDIRMSAIEYQYKLAEDIVKGINEYLTTV